MPSGKPHSLSIISSVSLIKVPHGGGTLLIFLKVSLAVQLETKQACVCVDLSTKKLKAFRDGALFSTTYTMINTLFKARLTRNKKKCKH